MNDPLVMLHDEKEESEMNKNVYLLLQKNWKIESNVVSIPKNEILRVLINLLAQVDLT